jgi:hypothetical protein
MWPGVAGARLMSVWQGIPLCGSGGKTPLRDATIRIDAVYIVRRYKQ